MTIAFIVVLLLLLSHFSHVWLCATPSLGFSRKEHWSGLQFPSPMHKSEKWTWSRSVMSDSLQPHGLQPTRLLCPWDFPGKSTGVGCHCLLRHCDTVHWFFSCASRMVLAMYHLRENGEKTLTHIFFCKTVFSHGTQVGFEDQWGEKTWGVLTSTMQHEDKSFCNVQHLLIEF